MKRFWLGAGLLALLLGLGIWVQLGMARLHAPIADSLEQAAQAAMEENWQQAELQSRQAARQWDRHRQFTAAAADHGPMDEVAMLLAEMQVYARERDKVYFAAACARAAQLIRATGEAHTLNWWNFL